MIKITQVRDGGNHVTQSTLTLDAWVERMKEEVKTCPVTMFRSQLRHFLPPATIARRRTNCPR